MNEQTTTKAVETTTPQGTFTHKIVCCRCTFQ